MTDTTSPRKPRSAPKQAFGGIRKLPSGRYQATIKRGTVSLGTFATRREAARKLAETQTDMTRGNWVDPAAGRALFAEYAEKWLKRRSNDPRSPLAPTTRAKYRRLLDAYLLPEFDNSQLVSIKSEQIRNWHDGIARQHPSTAADAYRLLSTVYNAAVSDEILVRSPCKRLERGTRQQPPERPTVTVSELQKAIDAAPEKYRLAFMLAAWCQLRRSEVLGLQRGDIDLPKGSLKIQRAWCLTSEGKTVEGPPKTAASRRTVYMPSHVREVMASHLESRSGAVWLFEKDGKPLHPRTFERAWERARAAAGRPDLHFHDLRHSGLTWFARTGATQAEIMRAAGHSSPAAANRYQHAEDERAKMLAEALETVAAQ